MSRMTPEEIRLRDEAIAAGRVVRAPQKTERERPALRHPDRIAQPRKEAKAPAHAVGGSGVRSMSIQRALEWAFGAEHARLEFDELSETAGSLRAGVDGIWLMMQRGVIGCEIDGGGRSEPAWDADIIASAVGSLPVEYGGRQMAVFVAQNARAGIVPDCMKDARPRWLPCDQHENQHGWTAVTAEAQHLGSQGWPVQERRGRKGRVHKEPVLYCPIYLSPTPAQIGKARRRYLDWWGALLWIGAELRSLQILRRIQVTQDMPPMTPWRAT